MPAQYLVTTGTVGQNVRSMLTLGVCSFLCSHGSHPYSVTAGVACVGAEVPWLIAIAMFLAQAIRKTGLGKRLSYFFISYFGSSTLGMTYSLVFRCMACVFQHSPPIRLMQGNLACDNIVLPTPHHLISNNGFCFGGIHLIFTTSYWNGLELSISCPRTDQ